MTSLVSEAQVIQWQCNKKQLSHSAESEILHKPPTRFRFKGLICRHVYVIFTSPLVIDG